MFGPYDVLVLAMLGVGYVAGRSRGFAWQASGIATLAIGLVAATVGSGAVARFFPDAWPDDLRRFAAWTAIYAVVEIAIYLVTLGLAKKIKELELDDLDRRWGGVLGTLRWGLGLAAVSIVLVAGSERARVFVQQSVSGMLLARVGMVARPLLPERIGVALEKTLREIDPTATAAPAPSVAPTVPARPVVGPARPPRPRTTMAPRLDGSSPPRPASSPAPAASPSAPDLDAPAKDDDDEPSMKPRDSGKTIEPEPEEKPSPEPRDPLAPRLGAEV